MLQAASVEKQVTAIVSSFFCLGPTQFYICVTLNWYGMTAFIDRFSFVICIPYFIQIVLILNQNPLILISSRDSKLVTVIGGKLNSST